MPCLFRFFCQQQRVAEMHFFVVAKGFFMHIIQSQSYQNENFDMKKDQHIPLVEYTSTIFQFKVNTVHGALFFLGFTIIPCVTLVLLFGN